MILDSGSTDFRSITQLDRAHPLKVLDVGAVPTGPTKVVCQFRVVKTETVLNAWRSVLSQSDVGWGHTKEPHLFARLMELAYISDSKPEFCGFDSHIGHQDSFRWWNTTCREIGLAYGPAKCNRPCRPS